MKIPASKVPAQVWADKMRTEGDLSEAESERLRRWDSSKQVYRVNSTLWDELKIDNKDEIPVSVFSKLPKDGLPQGLFSTLVAIEGSMPEAAGRVNGITDDMLKGAPAIGDALDAFLDFIGEDAVLAGHNITSFDIPFVQAAAAKSGRVFIYPYVIDTLEAARELWPDLPSRSMDSLRGILGIERTDAHRALADCYDELAVLNAELSVIMQSYARKMDYCRSELLRIAGVIAEEIGE